MSADRAEVAGTLRALDRAFEELIVRGLEASGPDDVRRFDAIGEELARGGMGKILFARDRRLRRDVVIKVTRRESGRIDPRFEREALITARLQHPSIVRVYDAGRLGDEPFYAMEHVRGQSLDRVL
ncbi:MAG: hypothetical protein KIT31_32855, partial [Deltaproteobacteria bacterium]|nr:hypothetical protein [Deltaproteobacteria bacterium]